MTTSTLKFAIIGCGNAAHEIHVPVFEDLNERVSFDGCASRRMVSAEALVRRIGGGTAYRSPDALLAESPAEWVVVCVPIDCTALVTLEVLRSGRNALVEKPLAAHPKLGREILSEANRLGRRVLVAEHYRHEQWVTTLAHLIRKNSFGKILSARLRSDRTVSPDSLTPWRKTSPLGFVLDGGIHTIAILHSLFGRLKPKSAYVDCIYPALGVADLLQAEVIADERTEVSLTFQRRISERRTSVLELELLGTEGMARFADGLLTVQSSMGDARVTANSHAAFCNIYREAIDWKDNRSLIEAQNDLEFLFQLVEVSNDNASKLEERKYAHV